MAEYTKTPASEEAGYSRSVPVVNRGATLAGIAARRKHDRLYVRFFAAAQTVSAFLGAYRWERTRAARVAGRLASADAALPQRTRISIRAFPCAAFRRHGHSHLRGRET